MTDAGSTTGRRDAAVGGHEPATTLAARRRRMVEQDVRSRGVKDEAVLAALLAVPREHFFPAAFEEVVYGDHPLPLGESEVASQPFALATMLEQLELRPTDRVLEVGTGSGYGSAVLAQLVHEVCTVELDPTLAADAEQHLAAAGATNVRLRVGDGRRGWPEEAPFDAVLVETGDPVVPPELLAQLADGGRLVLASRAEGRGQHLVRLRRVGDDVEEEVLGTIALASPRSRGQGRARGPLLRAGASDTDEVAEVVRRSLHPFTSYEDLDLGPLLERVGDASLVLLGEASHGTDDFYRLRDRITRALVEHKGFTVIAVEGDWPDAARIDAHVRGRPSPSPTTEPFARFPTWMWRNEAVRDHVRWLREHNASVEDPTRQVSFHGLDLYSLFESRDAVLAYLDRVDPGAATVARRRYGCLTPWEHDPASYGRATTSGAFAGCEAAVVRTLTDLLRQRLAYLEHDGDDLLDAVQNASVVVDAERYYRAMFYGSAASWNLRDQHMFETLQVVRSARGPGTKVVVWEHNSHVGDASATEMGLRGEHNVGMLCRQAFGDDAFLVGFGTDHGTVAAASTWGGPMHRKAVRPSHPDSYERVLHDTGVGAGFLHLREPDRPEVREALGEPRLERAIGVIYRPETELQSHYFQAVLPEQFDEYVWVDESHAVRPIAAHQLGGALDTYPFGL